MEYIFLGIMAVIALMAPFLLLAHKHNKLCDYASSLEKRIQQLEEQN